MQSFFECTRVPRETIAPGWPVVSAEDLIHQIPEWLNIFEIMKIFYRPESILVHNVWGSGRRPHISSKILHAAFTSSCEWLKQVLRLFLRQAVAHNTLIKLLIYSCAHLLGTSTSGSQLRWKAVGKTTSMRWLEGLSLQIGENWLFHLGINGDVVVQSMTDPNDGGIDICTMWQEDVYL